jgi:hypothetical protein
MFRILRWIIIVALVAVAFGYYRGWFSLHSTGDSSVQITVDRDKIAQDKADARAKAQDLRDK